MSYYTNRKRAQTVNTQPTMTDQSAAQETDINVIVREFMKTGHAAGPGEEPMYGDFTELPTDLRGMIERSREIEKYRRQLPPELKALPVAELLTLTPDKIKEILTPPKAEEKQ